MDHSPIKDLIGVVRKSPAMMITLGVVFVFLLIYLYERSKNASQAAATTGATQPGQFAGASGSYTFEENIHQTPAPSIPPPGMPTPAPAPGGVPVPKPPFGPLPPVPAMSAWTPLFSGKSPFPYSFGQNAYTTSLGGKQWTVGFGPGGRVWGVPGKVSIQQWQQTPIAIGQKQLLYQD